MDVTPYLDLNIAPRAVFDHLPTRRSRVRFMIPDGDDWRGITWQAFADQIRAFGQFLLDLGINPGERVAIYSPNRVEWISAALAIQSIGAVMVPIYPSSTADQAAYILEHSDARAVFADTEMIVENLLRRWDGLKNVLRVITFQENLAVTELVKKLRAQGVEVPSQGEAEAKITAQCRALSLGKALDEESAETFDRALLRVSLDQGAVMLYTSGTTGLPKGVPLTHRNIAVNGRDWLQCNASLISENAVDLLWLPMSHIFGFGEACLGNTLGFTTYLADPATVLQKLREVRPSVFMSVPRYFEKLVEMATQKEGRGSKAERLREITGQEITFALSGGAGLTKEVKDLFYEAGILIIEGYGLTEASPTLTLNRPDAFRFDTVGKPLPSVELKLASDGEILARGESIFQGYHKDPAATAGTFTDDGWLKTGDLGKFTEDGFLQIVGRKKEILVTAAGKNIAPVGIENHFVDDPYIAHLLVYGDGKRYLTAGVWINKETVIEALGAEVTERGIRGLIEPRIEAVNAGLARYERIKTFVIIDSPLTIENGLLTPTLKIKRKKVYEAFEREFESLYTEAAEVRP